MNLQASWAALGCRRERLHPVPLALRRRGRRGRPQRTRRGRLPRPRRTLGAGARAAGPHRWRRRLGAGLPRRADPAVALLLPGLADADPPGHRARPRPPPGLARHRLLLPRRA
ncbi:hypothetical protein NOCARDAX2BIS_380132 [Nocardioides sp. AX2bis]|nr:hypothetical protein NOCARDAX2BIS_380132 [Nocardioides sp. AX2bis]